MKSNLSKNFIGGFTGNADIAKKVKRARELLNNFDSTNNGVIYVKPKTHKGGAFYKANQKPLNTCAIAGYSENPIDICKATLIIHDFNHLKNYIISDLSKENEQSIYNLKTTKTIEPITEDRKIDDILIDFYIKNKRIPGENEKFYNSDVILGDKLIQYISNNISNAQNVSNILRFDTHCKYKISDLEKVGNDTNTTSYTIGATTSEYYHEGENERLQDFSHKGYNRDIVQAYEKHFIDNIPNLPKFIQQQYEHIKSMSLTDKIVINDYTKKSCFYFYSAFAGKLVSKEGLESIKDKKGHWVDKYSLEWYGDDPHNKTPKLYGFGDSFFKQIFAVINKNIDRFNPVIKTKLNHPGYPHDGVSSINEYWDFLKNNDIERVKPNEVSIFWGILTNEEWDEVMRTFIEDIDNIIAKAPDTKSEIYCYRAVSGDYINLHMDDDTLAIDGPKIYRKDEGTYVNARIGSFSLNFDSSVRYLGTDDTTGRKTGTMYRAFINKGVKVLYIPSLSYASDEFEILHASYGIFVDKKENYKCYNNKKNKYGILSYEDDQFNSARVGLAGYSKNIKSDTFDEIKTKLIGLLLKNDSDSDNAKNSLRNIYHNHAMHIIGNKEEIESTVAKLQPGSIELVEKTADGVDDTLDNDFKASKEYVNKLTPGGARKKAAKNRDAKKN
jgi:hypothetical protein